MEPEFFSDKYSMRLKNFGNAVLVDQERLPRGKKFILGDVSVSAPVVFKLEEGDKNRDVIGTIDLSMLVSERVIKVLKENNFTGWTTYPVELYDKNDTKFDRHYGLIITGRSGPPDNSRSYRKKFPPYGEGLPSYEEWAGLFFDEDTWDHSDFFVPKTTLHICVTQRAKEALEKAGISNVQFERLDEIQRSLAQ